MDHNQILEKPIITEKTNLALTEGNYVTFKVLRTANKLEIRRAIEKIFSVTVLSVNTCVVKGKKKRFGRYLGQAKPWKKAVVRLKDGDRIELFEGA